MHEVVKTSRPVRVDESDLIGLEEAARLSGRRVNVIAAMLDRGRLPWYQRMPLARGMAGERVVRLTSRAAVLALPAANPRSRSRLR